jgi:hypothetical protein
VDQDRWREFGPEMLFWGSVTIAATIFGALALTMTVILLALPCTKDAIQLPPSLRGIRRELNLFPLALLVGWFVSPPLAALMLISLCLLAAVTSVWYAITTPLWLFCHRFEMILENVS